MTAALFALFVVALVLDLGGCSTSIDRSTCLPADAVICESATCRRPHGAELC